MLGSLDPAKILFILVIALVVVGPQRLPQAARQLASAWRELSRIRETVREEVRSALPDLGLDELDLPHLPKNPSAAVGGFVRDLASGFGGTQVANGATGGDREATASAAEVSVHAAPAPRSGPSRIASGSRLPERGSLVVAEPSRGELGVVFDDPSMN
ncbi:MAG: twin-arginine translocase TatA/TatE family subunit [Actinomycetota bacterium]|nr:twin-arginine translocase TatA/TatE family subunit [Actinomycetota bacterium]